MIAKLLVTTAVLIGGVTTTEPLSTQGNIALEAISPHYIEYKVTHKELLSCLIHYESGGVEDAVGDHGLAYGVLQYHLSTFNQYKEKYELSWLRYEEAKDQVRLADTMLKEDFGNLRHWTTAWRCSS